MNAIALPKHGIPREQLSRELDERKIDDIRAHFSRAFRGPPDVQEVGKDAFVRFMADNGLFSLRTDYLRRIEEEVLAMCVSLFHPPAGASGTFTSGGSESIFTALHAIREWARERYPHITAPEIVVPASAHPTFSKGAHLFCLKLVRVPLGPDFRADVVAMERAITPNTIALAGSAPCWPYALYDPIEKLGELAIQRGLWLHVDACVGGYLAPFAEKLGHPLPAWDFRVPAVQSISADLHKLGYCPKPASTVLWRSEDLKRYHYVHPDDWPGGPYKMHGFAGTRTAGPLFAAWAVLRYLGQDGYLRLTRELLAARRQLMDDIDAIPGLRAREHDLLPIPIASDGVDLQAVMGRMRELGWILVGAADPPLINVPLDPAALPQVVEVFVREIADVTAGVRKTPVQAPTTGQLHY